MEYKSCSILFQKVFPFWNKLTEAEKQKLCSNTAEKFYHKDENIHGGTGACTGGILVKSGSVRTYLLSEDGKEVTLYRLFAGDLCMLSASCVLKSITFDVFVDAQEDTECYIINGKAFAEITNSNIYAENFAMQMAVKRFSDVIWVMQQILFMSYDKRLAIFLYEESLQTKSDTIALTQEQIAKYTGSAREVVSRMLKYFASEGIVSHTRGGVTITDKAKLKAIAQN